MLLRGKDLVPNIKEHQAKLAKQLITHGIKAKLVIIQALDDPVIDTYVRMKKQYGADIGVDVDIYNIKQADIAAKLTELNNDESVSGIIVQLPITNMAEADELLAQVAPEKDVDGLGPEAKFRPATPTAILNLLKGYKIGLKNRKV